MNVTNKVVMKKDIRVNIIGHSGVIYIKRPSFSWIYFIFLGLTFWIMSLTNYEISGLTDLASIFLGLPVFLSVLTILVLDQIQRKDIWTITDEENYLVFLLTKDSKPIDNGLITKIENNVFLSWNPIEREEYYVLKFSDFHKMATHNLFWINGKRVQMEYWKGSRGLPHKFISTAKQQDFLERINRVYQRTKNV